MLSTVAHEFPGPAAEQSGHGGHTHRSPRLRVSNLVKTFRGFRALDGASLDVEAGEIHAIVGQNGCGKSTLVKTLAGYHKPDSGSIEIDAALMPLPLTPKTGRKHGLAVVHQDLGLIPELSVAENIRISQFGSALKIRWKDERRQAAAILARLGSDLNVDAPVRSLGPADRTIVGIARALQVWQSHPAGGLLLLDESTRALPRHALDDFHKMLRTICDQGASVLLITHQLPEALQVGDRVSVLRGGRVVEGGIPTHAVTESDLATMMLGAKLADFAHSGAQRIHETHEPLATYEGLTGRQVNDLKFSIAAGETLGIIGLPGSGHEELPYLLTGAQPARSGTCTIDGSSHDIAGTRPKDWINRDIVLVPENRVAEGLAVGMTIKDNLTLPRFASNGRPHFLGEAWRAQECATAITQLGIVPPNPNSLISELSGGNQQKVMIAKWLLNSPQLVILHEPTQGIDVGARLDVLKALRSTAEAGAGVIVSSTETEDLVAICDRVLVLQEGRVAYELTAPFTTDDLLSAIYERPTRPADEGTNHE